MKNSTPYDVALRPINVLGLCAGAGGLELGIRIAEPRARNVCLVEREAYAAADLAARMEDGWLHPAPIWSDIGTFDPEPWRGVVHCVASGDPCQPNSVAGKRGGASDDRWLIDQVLRVVDRLWPDRVFRENVTGNADGQLAALVPALERMGYRVAAGIFSAAEGGGPAHHEDRRDAPRDHAHGCDAYLADPKRRDVRERGVAPSASAEVPEEIRQQRFRADAESDGGIGRGDTAGTKLGDADRDGFGAGRRECLHREGAARPFAAHPGQAVADADDEGPQGSGPGEPQRWNEPAACGDDRAFLPLFAPGPADPFWGEILGHSPHLEPAVCRVADGAAHELDPRRAVVDFEVPTPEQYLAYALRYRVDRLRACGNAVVPLAAAYAWRTLEASLQAERAAHEREPSVIWREAR